MPEPALRSESITAPPGPVPAGWIAVKEAAQILAVTPQTIRNWIAADRVAGRMCQADGGAAWYVDPASHDRLAAFCMPVEQGLAVGRKLAELSARQRQEAADRLAIVMEWRAVRDKHQPGHQVAELFAVWSDAHAVRTGRKRPVSWTTMWRWERALADGEGIVELAPQRAGRRPAESSIEAWAFFQTLYLTQQRRTIYDCWLQTSSVARKHHWDWPTYNAIRRKVGRDIPRPTLVLARQGQKAFDDHCVPFVERDYDSIAPNDWWVVDHHQLDVAAIGPNGRPAFPWLTMWYDAKSRKPMGWMLHFQPCLDVVLASLRRALLLNGVPKHLYFDNGKEFRAKEFTGGRRKIRVELDEALVRASLHHLPTQVHFAAPYNAKAKSVERWFRTLRMQFSQQWQAYRGNNVDHRPEGLDRLLNAYETNGLVPKLADLAAGLSEWIEQVYCKTAHGGRGMHGRSPEQVYREELAEITRVGEDELILLMMRTTAPLTVHRNGVTLWGRSFAAPELFAHQGEKVYARYDPALIGRLYLFDREDRLVCIAQRKDLMAWGANHDDLTDAMKAKHQAKKLALSYIEASDLTAGDALQNIALRRQATEQIARTAGPPEPPDGDGGQPNIRMFRSALADAQEAIRNGAMAAGLERVALVDVPEVDPTSAAGIAPAPAADAEDVFDSLRV